MGANDGIDPKFLDEICRMIEPIQAMVIEAVKLIKPQVEGVICNHVTDEHQIKMLLDRLLDYTGMCDEGLILFKRLCRYYYMLNPRATAEYVYLYRDLYDSDDDYEE